MADLVPFTLVETSPGEYSLLLSTFAPADAVFAKHDIEGGGYAWEGIARHLIEDERNGLEDRVGLDPEGSMFCAYGQDREALTELGRRLAALFHDPAKLEAVILEIGPDGFED